MDIAKMQENKSKAVKGLTGGIEGKFIMPVRFVFLPFCRFLSFRFLFFLSLQVFSKRIKSIISKDLERLQERIKSPLL
jgi:hypothetical protein